MEGDHSKKKAVVLRQATPNNKVAEGFGSKRGVDWLAKGDCKRAGSRNPIQGGWGPV